MTYNTLSDDGNAASTMAANQAAQNPNDEIVTIATYQSIIEADLVRSELESRGITAYVSGATVAQTFISMPETGITVQVASSDAATARQVADELANSTPVFGDGDDDEDDYDVDAASDTDLATPPGSDSADDVDYEYDVNEDDEDARATEQVDASGAASNPRSPVNAAFQDAYPDPAGVAGSYRESEVDIQRKPGQSSGMHMYDDAEAGG